jgi:hypothetical protein
MAVLCKACQPNVDRTVSTKITRWHPRAFVRLTDNWIGLDLMCPGDTDWQQVFGNEIGQHVPADFAPACNSIGLEPLTITLIPTTERIPEGPVL